MTFPLVASTPLNFLEIAHSVTDPRGGGSLGAPSSKGKFFSFDTQPPRGWRPLVEILDLPTPLTTDYTLLSFGTIWPFL